MLWLVEDRLDGLLSVAGLAHDLELGPIFEKLDEAFSHDLVIIYNDYACHF